MNPMYSIARTGSVIANPVHHDYSLSLLSHLYLTLPLTLTLTLTLTQTLTLTPPLTLVLQTEEDVAA